MTPKPPVYYQVSQPQVINEELRRLFWQAVQLGIRKVFLEAAKYTVDELGYDPLGFGESRGALSGLELQLRIAFAPPLYVWFAVHEPSKQVFVRHFGMRGRRKR